MLRFVQHFFLQTVLFLQLLKDNLTIAYEKVSIFIRPLYMALSYEKTQGPLHSPLAQVLSEIHTNVNASSVMLSSKVTKTTRFFSGIQLQPYKKIMNTFSQTSLLLFLGQQLLTFLQTFQMVKNGFHAPTASTGNSTAQMNQTIRLYLQALANNNLLVSYPFIQKDVQFIITCEMMNRKYLEIINFETQ